MGRQQLPTRVLQPLLLPGPQTLVAVAAVVVGAAVVRSAAAVADGEGRRVLDVGRFVVVAVQPVTAHFGIPRSIPTHLQNASILLSCICSDWGLLAIATSLLTYAPELVSVLDVPNVYLCGPMYSHLSRGIALLRICTGVRGWVGGGMWERWGYC